MKPGYYFIENTLTGEKYVGSTRNLSFRKAQHFSKLNSGTHNSSKLQKAYSLNPSLFKFIEFPTLTKEEAIEFEQKILDELHLTGTLYNVAPNARNPAVGWVRSQEVRKRMSVASSKALTGVKKSAEHVENMRKARLGKKHSQESRIKMGLSRRGLKMPDSTRNALRLANIGKPMSQEHIDKLRLINTGKIKSESTLEKLRIASTGRISTVQTRAKISAYHSNRLKTDEEIEKIKEAITIQRGIGVVAHNLIFDSIAEAARTFDTDEKTVKNRVKNIKFPHWGVFTKRLLMNTNAVSNRVIGDFPLSIASSLALQGAKGIHPDQPQQTKNLLLNYAVIWVNLKTLFRNLYEAISREEVLSVNPQDLFDGFSNEVDQFEKVILAETDAKIRVVYYVSDYANMKQVYSHAILRGDTTHLQKAYSAALVTTLGPYIRANRSRIKTFSLKITELEMAKTLILTHFPFDLFAPNIKNLSLLESHTGAIKAKHLWYTKYYNGKELSQIPFREDFIQVFGDKEHFHPWSIGIRKQILEIADKYKWSSVSTTAKIDYGLDTLSDKYLRDRLRALR